MSGGNMGVVGKTVVCEKHGEYISQVTTIMGSVFESACPECQAAWESGNMSEPGTDRVERKIPAGIGARFAKYTFDDYATENEMQQKALTTSRKIVENFQAFAKQGTTFLFHGNVGTGKTMLVSIIAMELQRRGIPVTYASVLQAIRRVRKTFSGLGDEQAEIDKLSRCPLLILEEVGVQLGTPYEISILHEIFDERYKAVLPTIITSNLSPAAIEDYLGPRIWRRIRGGGTGMAVTFDWREWRGRS
jgi:DNA replication protein DnaC